MRTAHYVASTHWDREWYETFQGYRMRLVSLLDEVLTTLANNSAYAAFVMDGQLIPVLDFLEVRPEKTDQVRQFVRQGRLKLGPWYVLPDEWLVSGESLIRNLQMGMSQSAEFGAESSRAGIVCDQFGHIGQLPQLFVQLGIAAAMLWRGTHERDHAGHFNWRGSDGTVLPAYRFGRNGYCTYAMDVRGVLQLDTAPTYEEKLDRLVEYTIKEAARSELAPILLYDGADHMEIDPGISALIESANQRLAAVGIRIVHSDLDAYQNEVIQESHKIKQTLSGELRQSGREALALDEQWLIPGVLSSRIHLKQRNAECEDELCSWAEPFAAFAASRLGIDYPSGYLRLAWKHLLENHPHDSICGCSIDQVHQDMVYRFDQSLGISSGVAREAMKAIAVSAAPAHCEGMVLTIFNATNLPVGQPVDLDIPLPADWPTRFKEFFGYEEKFSFRLRGPDGQEIPYQLTGQTRDQKSFRRRRYKFPQPETRQLISITAAIEVPALGYTTLAVEPCSEPTRYSGSMVKSHLCIENQLLRVNVNTNGTIDLTDLPTGNKFEQLLTFEDRADIGDGWFHGLAVNDQICFSSAAPAEISLVADGIGKATFRICLKMNLPREFDFTAMRRGTETAGMKITSEVTLRAGSDHVEVVTHVENNVCDHRLRVLLPTRARGHDYSCDSTFDVVRRPIGLAEDNDRRRELDVETRPQVTWTAFGDNERGLAVISRGLPESTVCDREDRPIALTLLRSFRRAIFANDNVGGQIQGRHTFRYNILPYHGPAPIDRLFHLGQIVDGPVRMIAMSKADLADARAGLGVSAERLTPSASFLGVKGNVVVTSVQRIEGALQVRLFNPHDTPQIVEISVEGRSPHMRAILLNGQLDPSVLIEPAKDMARATVGARRIATFAIQS